MMEYEHDVAGERGTGAAHFVMFKSDLLELPLSFHPTHVYSLSIFFILFPSTSLSSAISSFCLFLSFTSYLTLSFTMSLCVCVFFYRRDHPVIRRQ